MPKKPTRKRSELHIRVPEPMLAWLETTAAARMAADVTGTETTVSDLAREIIAEYIRANTPAKES